MLKTHEDDVVVQPDPVDDTPQTEEHPDNALNVPSQLWMASQLSQLADRKVDPAVAVYQYEAKAAQLYEMQYKEQQTAKKKQFVPRVTEKAALAARGSLATQLHYKQIVDQPQSAVFKTYGREYPTTQYKISYLGTSEPGNICPRTVIDTKVPVVKLRENKVGETVSYEVYKEEVNVASLTRVYDSALYNKSMLQKCYPNGTQNACFRSPARTEVAPNICKLTANEETNAYYRTKTPARTDYREPQTKNEHVFRIDYQKAATMCRTTLLRYGDMANHSPLKGKIYPPKEATEAKMQQHANWYLNTQDADILMSYAYKRKQMLYTSERYNKRVRDMDDSDYGEADPTLEHYQTVRDRMVDQVARDVELRTRTKSPWTYWGLPEKVAERKQRELAQGNKKVDAASAFYYQYLQQYKYAANVKKTENYYFEQTAKEEAYRKKKMGSYYYPEKSAAVSPSRYIQQQPFNGYAGSARKFDLLKENKYINENVSRPLDMQLVAKLRRQSASDSTLAQAVGFKSHTIGYQYADALKAQHRAMSSHINKFDTEYCIYTRPGSTPSRYATHRSYKTAIPPSSANMKNQDLSKQLDRTSPCRARNYVNLTRTENFLEVNRLADKDVEYAEQMKFAFAAEMRGLIKDNTGKDLTVQANQMLMEYMGKRLKIMNYQNISTDPLYDNSPKSVNDLKPKYHAQHAFAKYSGRTEPECTGQKNLMITVTERQRRIKEENYDTQLTFEDMSRQKIDYMAVNLQQGEDLEGFKPSYVLKQRVERYDYDKTVSLQDRIEKESRAFYSQSTHENPQAFAFAKSGRERLSNKFVAQTTTNISVGSASLLIYDGAKLKMSPLNQNFFDYSDVINPTYTYKNINGTRMLVKDLNVYDRNDHTRLSAEAAINAYSDVVYNPKQIDAIFGKKDKPINFGKYASRKNPDLHVNDLQYDIKYGVVERRAGDMVNIGKQSGKK